MKLKVTIKLIYWDVYYRIYIVFRGSGLISFLVVFVRLKNKIK